MTAPVQARLYRGTPHNLRRLAAALGRGELVAVPTETVYGLAGDATNARACREIFRAKRRPANDPLIVHLHHLNQLSEVAQPNEAAFQVAKAFWPGPLTVVLPKQPSVPDIVTSGGDSVAVRMPAHRLFRQLLRLSGRPLAAPSANPFGYVSPTTAEHVRAGLGTRIKHILDGGPCPIGVESTILDLRDPSRPVVLRPGAISAEAIAQVLKRPVQQRQHAVVAASAAAPAPGLLARHYSPKTPVQLYERDLPAARAGHEAFVHFRRPARALADNEFFLSRDGRGRTAARRLFALLRELDAGQWRRLHIEQAPAEDPLAPAINDRLRRAAARR
jgi:L-threonylcarbamoyladenylate synthase